VEKEREIWGERNRNMGRKKRKKVRKEEKESEKGRERWGERKRKMLRKKEKERERRTGVLQLQLVCASVVTNNIGCNDIAPISASFPRRLLVLLPFFIQ
jgi:hypothetical protein